MNRFVTLLTGVSPVSNTICDFHPPLSLSRVPPCETEPSRRDERMLEDRDRPENTVPSSDKMVVFVCRNIDSPIRAILVL